MALARHYITECDCRSMSHRWPESTIFGNDMFGRAIGSAENNYQLTEGRFGNVSSIYDPDDTLVDSDISPYHNAYGYINAEYNYQVRS